MIPTRDREDHLRRAVASALGQRQYPNVEVIVQNGGRPVDLPDDPRLLVLNQPDLSIAHAVNLAAEHATGEVLHFACDDDVMAPTAVANAVKTLQTHDAEWTYSAINRIRPKGVKAPRVVDRHGGTVFNATPEQQGLGIQGGLPWNEELFRQGNFVPQPSVFWTRRAWETCGPMDETFPLCFDYEMWGRLASRFPPAVARHVAADYTVWPGSTSVHSPHLQAREADAIRIRWDSIGFGNRPTDKPDFRLPPRT
jgi:glycosyltransferase involved in cell wall biosynthesis